MKLNTFLNRENIATKHAILFEKDIEIERFDPYRLVFIQAVERNYPFSSEIYELFFIEQTVNFLNFYKIEMMSHLHLTNQYISKKCIFQVFRETNRIDINNNENCKFMNINSLKKLSMFKNNDNLQKEILKLGYDRNVYVCILHSDYFHFCAGKYCQFLKKLNDKEYENICRVSGNIVTIKKYNPYVNDNYQFTAREKGENELNGMFEHINREDVLIKRKIKKDRNTTIYTKISYQYEGKDIFSIEEYDKIKKMFRNIIRDVIEYKDIKELVWENLYEIYNKFLHDNIIYCTATQEKIKKKRKNTMMRNKLQLPVRRKVMRRRKRKLIPGNFDKNSSNKLRFEGNIKREKDFITKKKEFFLFIKKVKKIQSVRILTFTTMNNVASSSVNISLSSIQNKPISKNAYIVDNIKLKWYTQAIKLENIKLKIEEPILFQFLFLFTERVQRVIVLDIDKEIFLRNKNHPYLIHSSRDFLDGLEYKVNLIRRLCPGLFRIIMSLDDLKNKALDKYSSLKTIIKDMHNKSRMVNFSNIRDKYLKLNYKENYLDETISDEKVLEIAEKMYWCEKQCLSHPFYEAFGTSELTKEIIYVGCIYLSQTGLKLTKTTNEVILPKDQLLCKRGYLIPQNKLGSFLTTRRNVSDGINFIKKILLSKCKIMPVHEVSFLHWKEKHSELTYSSSIREKNWL